MHLLLITALPAWLTYAFYALVAWGVAAVLAACRALSTGTRMSVLLRLGFGVWLVVPAYLANAGVLSQFDAMPPMLVRVVVPMVVLIVTFSFSRAGAWAAERLPFGLLIAVQIFRLPLEVLLHQLHGHRVLPADLNAKQREAGLQVGKHLIVKSGLAVLGQLAVGHEERKRPDGGEDALGVTRRDPERR